MTQPATSILTGRLGRTAKVGGLLGGEVARTYAAKAANLGRSPEDRRDADGSRRPESNRGPLHYELAICSAIAVFVSS
jgi:hypothetical protein